MTSLEYPVIDVEDAESLLLKEYVWLLIVEDKHSFPDEQKRLRTSTYYSREQLENSYEYIHCEGQKKAAYRIHIRREDLR